MLNNRRIKQLLISSLLVTGLIVPTSFASAQIEGESETTLDFSSVELQEELNRADENTKKAKANLDIDKKELKKALKELKKINPEKYELVTAEIEKEESEQGMFSTLATSSAMGTIGDVLVTYDQAFKDWNHGHAAIVAENSDYLIEAMPSSGVRYYPNRWGDYNTKKKMYVNTTYSNISNAYGFIRDQLGKPYSLAAAKDQTSVYYCSLLVWKGYNRQGVDLDGNGGLIVTPADLELSSKTIAY